MQVRNREVKAEQVVLDLRLWKHDLVEISHHGFDSRQRVHLKLDPHAPPQLDHLRVQLVCAPQKRSFLLFVLDPDLLENVLLSLISIFNLLRLVCDPLIVFDNFVTQELLKVSDPLLDRGNDLLAGDVENQILLKYFLAVAHAVNFERDI